MATNELFNRFAERKIVRKGRGRYLTEVRSNNFWIEQNIILYPPNAT